MLVAEQYSRALGAGLIGRMLYTVREYSVQRVAALAGETREVWRPATQRHARAVPVARGDPAPQGRARRACHVRASLDLT